MHAPHENASEPAYLSIVQWNDAGDPHKHEFARIEALVAAAAMDPDQAALAVRRGVPQVVMQIDAAVRDDILAVLHARGHLAFAPTRSEIRGFGRPAAQMIKSLSRMDGWYGCEMWRSEPTSFRCDDIFLIVRGSLRTTTARSAPRRHRSSDGGLAWGGGMLMAPTHLPFGHLGDFLPDEPIGPSKSTSTSMSEVADLYRRDGSRLRLDADKLSFEVLGEQRGLSDRQNMDTLLDLLRRDCSGAIIDEMFKSFRCPPQIARRAATSISGASSETTTDRPVFDFYSPWCYLLYRSLLPG